MRRMFARDTPRLDQRVNQATFSETPVSRFVDKPDEEGTLVRYMFPAPGEVRSLTVHIEELPKDTSIVRLFLDSKYVGGSGTLALDCIKGISTFDQRFDVQAGDRLLLRTSTKDISSIHFSFTLVSTNARVRNNAPAIEGPADGQPTAD